MTHKVRIAVIDDDADATAALRARLRHNGYDVECAADSRTGLHLLETFAADVVVAELHTPGMGGPEWPAKIKARRPDTAVIVMAARDALKTAVQAMRQGADDYVSKPVDVEELEVVLQRALETKGLREETRNLRERVEDKYKLDNLVGECPAILAALKTLRQAAPTNASVLLIGEGGTGKERFAQALHQSSPRRRRPFVKVACAALGETLLASELFGHEKGAFSGALFTRAGRFEAADGGTLFLDEVGDIGPVVQQRLLRFFEQGTFERVGAPGAYSADVRVVAATQRDLPRRVAEGTFREDLYQRLSAIQVPVPPLRARGHDIALLAHHFLRRYAESNDKPVATFGDEVSGLLLRYPWPGNVRELEYAVERAIVLAGGPKLEESHFPTLQRSEHSGAGATLATRIPGSSLADLEREAILRTLEAVSGSTSRAAAMLGISPRKIQYKIKEYQQSGAILARAR